MIKYMNNIKMLNFFHFIGIVIIRMKKKVIFLFYFENNKKNILFSNQRIIIFIFYLCFLKTIFLVSNGFPSNIGMKSLLRY